MYYKTHIVLYKPNVSLIRISWLG